MTTNDLKRLGFTFGGEFIDPKSPKGRLDNPHKHLLPDSPGVYAWVVDDRVMYVGYARTKLFRRLVEEHLKAVPRQPDRRFYVEARHDMRNALGRGERVYIFIRSCPRRRFGEGARG